MVARSFRTAPTGVKAGALLRFCLSESSVGLHPVSVWWPASHCLAARVSATTPIWLVWHSVADRTSRLLQLLLLETEARRVIE